MHSLGMHQLARRFVRLEAHIFPAEVHGLYFEWPDVLLTLVAGLRDYGLVCALAKKAIPSVDKAQVHVHMEVACTLTFLINVHISVPFLKLDVDPARESLPWTRRSLSGLARTSFSS